LNPYRILSGNMLEYMYIMKKVIPFRQSLFWDVDPKTIDPKKNARYVIERILDFGNGKEVKWMWQHYSIRAIKKVLLLPRAQLHKKSKALWSLMLK